MELERHGFIGLEMSLALSTWKEKRWIQHTLDVNVLTRLCRSSRETLAGKLTAGAKAEPSSSDTNWTMTLGDCSGGLFSGSGTPLYSFCRLGGGSKVAIGREDIGVAHGCT